MRILLLATTFLVLAACSSGASNIRFSEGSGEVIVSYAEEGFIASGQGEGTITIVDNEGQPLVTLPAVLELSLDMTTRTWSVCPRGAAQLETGISAQVELGHCWTGVLVERESEEADGSGEAPVDAVEGSGDVPTDGSGEAPADGSGDEGVPL